MNKENIKNIVKFLNNQDYKDLFAALVIFEKIDYLHDLNDLNDDDITYLENLYKKYLNNDSSVNLINIKDIENL